ncbi:hypothetical protein [Rhizomonospora bruguierae]|uniref:hypothetical protein n=1 Tax=Rhizomonospora bruguierae TaxID=1581705 RepID=UPI001BD1527E|nr:hypothetical protein [Micromonospora sp. NBRC 107566]
MTDVPIFLGRPEALHALPYPRGGADITRARTRAAFTLGSGGIRMAQLPGGKRRFSYAWQSLDMATYAIIQAFDQGHEGPGPFVLLDPSQVNMLTDNQSAATSVRNDTRNFTVSGSGGTLASDATINERGPASLRWDFAVGNPAGALLTIDSPSPEWPGVPVVNNSVDGPDINANPLFEADVSDWAPNAGEGTVTWSTAQAHEGAASLLLTPDGAGTQAAAHSTAVPGISPGQMLRASAWVRCAVGRNIQLRIDWRTGGGTYLSSTTTTTAVVANTWTHLDVVGTAPATTAQAGITVLMTGTPPIGHLLHVDEARLRRFTPGRSLCFSFRVLGGGTNPAVTLTPQLRWLNAAGATLATTSGTAVAATDIARTTMFVTGTPPLSAAFVVPQVAATGASISAAAKLWLEQLQLEAASAPTAWRPGTGVLPVQVVSLPESWPWGWPDHRSGAILTLQEVGA